MSKSPEELRRRFVEIADELRSLPADAFARKHELATEADTHRARLAEVLESDLREAGDQWAERAGRKGTHSVDEGEKLAGAAIPSPVDT